MAHAGDVGTDCARVADDPELAARLDDRLHRTCSLARPRRRRTPRRRNTGVSTGGSSRRDGRAHAGNLSAQAARKELDDG